MQRRVATRIRQRLRILPAGRRAWIDHAFDP